MLPVKLPFNKTEDPWFAAQAFLHRHSLPQNYLETVANYIIKNAHLESSDLPSTRAGGGFDDPFTGGGRYVPGGAGGVTSNQRQRGRLEVTGEYFPVKEYVTMEAINVTLLLGMLSFRYPSSNTDLSFTTQMLSRQADWLQLIGACSTTSAHP